MNINYGDIQSDATVGSPDALPEMQDILGYRMGLGLGVVISLFTPRGFCEQAKEVQRQCCPG